MKLVSRRQVIKTFVLGAAFSNVIGRNWAGTFLGEVQPAPAFTAGILKVDLDDFPVLAQPLGSVRLGTFPIDGTNKTDAWLKPIIINRGDADDFHVVSAVCTHEGCIVRKLDPVSRAMICPCHGSAYFIDGGLRNGPAGSPLSIFTHRREGSSLIISVPELFYDVTFNRSPSNTRVQIQFVAFYQTRYEVYFRERLDAPAQVVPFALTESGPLTLTELTGNENSEYATLYLDKPGTAGFFQVAVKAGQV
jgi:Rieske Fe-S protein